MPRLNIWIRRATILVLASMLQSPPAHGESPGGAAPPHRLLVLTDIEADPDDTQTLVRLLLYSNVIDIQGLIATTSVHLKTRVSPDSIRRVIEAYGETRDNLMLHEAGYPEAGALLALVKQGLPVYGMQGVGEGHDSEGSEWILKVLEQHDDRPLWVSVWGGPNTLAQALHKLRATRDEADVRRLVARLRVYTISDQDDSAIWIRNNFPDLFYIVSPGGSEPRPGPESTTWCPGSTTRRSAIGGSRSTSSRATGRWARGIPTSPTAWRETRRRGSR